MTGQEKSWTDIVKQAEHYKAIGQIEIWLGTREDVPWEMAKLCEEGGVHRLGICKSVTFTADHPCGLTFRWFFDIEDRGANGTGRHAINVARCRRVLAMLPKKARDGFLAFLASAAKGVEKTATEFQDVADEQREKARQLREASRALTRTRAERRLSKTSAMRAGASNG